jgi:hypothetical protein
MTALRLSRSQPSLLAARIVQSDGCKMPDIRLYVS